MNFPKEEKSDSGVAEAMPESQEIISPLSQMKDFSDDLVREGIENFWPNRKRHPELNGNGVTKEELHDKVQAAMRVRIANDLPRIVSLVRGAKDPEKAFEDLCGIYVNETEEMMRLSYESLVHLRKIGIDELTGLPNRKVFDRSLKDALERNARFGQTFSFIIFDLDHFKAVNDTYGHEAGDDVLQEMARRLSQDSKLRRLDAVVRYGGEEFALILPGTAQEGACIVAERISKQVGSSKFKVTDKEGKLVEIPVTTSIGISEYTHFADDPGAKELMRRADTCLYILKGKVADADGVTANRRGQIACNNRVVSPEEIEEYRVEYSKRRSSFPAPKAVK